MTFFDLLFFAFALVLFAVGRYRDMLFLGIVVVNVLIGIVQELRVKHALDRVSLLSAPTATVVRDGRARTIPAQELVLDDIVLLSAGDQVCAAAPALMAVSTFLVSRVKARLRCSGPLPRQAEAFS